MNNTLPDPAELNRSLTGQNNDTTDRIPPETVLELDEQGERQRWKGTFRYKVPTIADRIQIARLKSEYLPKGGEADSFGAALTEMVCYLAVTISEAPKWWKPMELYDETPVAVLYGRARSYERKFHGEPEASESDRTGSESDGGDGSSLGGDGETGMGRKVQPPAERSETIISHSKGGA